MNVRLILMLSLLGLVVGILSVVGVVHAGGPSLALWIVLALYFGTTLSRRVVARAVAMAKSSVLRSPASMGVRQFSTTFSCEKKAR